MFKFIYNSNSLEEQAESINLPQNAFSYLNWFFEEQKNPNNEPNVNKNIDSLQFFIMGNSYIAISFKNLYQIYTEGNKCKIADHLIFPILFNLMHGLECWLKSGTLSFSYLYNLEGKIKKSHDLEILYSEFKRNVTNTSLGSIVNKYIEFNFIEDFISNLKLNNVRFDFARYSSFESGGVSQSQFYCGYHNICIDMSLLLQFYFYLIQDFRTLISYILTCCECNEVPEESGYAAFIAEGLDFKFDDISDIDIFIYQHLLGVM